MKYFTLEWWISLQDWRNGYNGEPWKQYNAYYQSVKSELPRVLIDLHENVVLHDSHLKELNFDVHKNSIIIKLDGDNKDGNFRKIILTYGEIKSFKSTVDAENAFTGEGYGDLGYHEVEKIGDSLYEHRILFASGIELIISFKNLKLDYFEDIE